MEGRIPTSQAISMPPLPPLATLPYNQFLRRASRVAPSVLFVPLLTQDEAQPLKRRGSEEHRDGANLSSNVARVSLTTLVRLASTSDSAAPCAKTYVNACPTSDSNALLVTMRWQKRGYDRC